MARGNLPSVEQLAEWLANEPGRPTVKAAAKAFGVKPGLKPDLKRMMDLAYAPKPKSDRPASPIGLYELVEITADGDLIAAPLEEPGPNLPVAAHLPLTVGERFLGRNDTTQVKLVRRLQDVPDKIAGILRVTPEGARIVPLAKGEMREWSVPDGMTFGAQDGELVEAEPLSKGARMGLPRARVIARIGDPSAPKAVSLTAIWQHGIPDQFPPDVLAEAESAVMPTGPRLDLTHLPFVTIDPEDARDHDDAIYAVAEGDFHRCYVAIADVAAFVQPGSALDREAQNRGNSTYFPDRVVPMLPDRLSGDLCSLHEGVDRPVLVAEVLVDKTGVRQNVQFHRATIRSRASLTYEAAQQIFDTQTGAHLGIVNPLFAAWAALKQERQHRAPLALELPERRIILDAQGRVTSIEFREHLDAHQLIEDFMILANVAVAEVLLDKKIPQIFRVHAEPDREKLKSLSDTAQASGMVLAKGQVIQTRHLNKLLAQADGTEFDELINMSVLRSMAQAVYDPDNIGHFGLALRNYAHFTSPIRRYADLMTHRALIAALKLGPAFDLPQDDLSRIADHISLTERRSMVAERETTDRYLAAYMSERIGSEMSGRISGVQKFGCFVKLDETGADGLIPVRSLGDEFFRFDARDGTLIGSNSQLTISLGLKVTVKLAEAIPVTGGLIFDLVAIDGQPLSKGKPRRARRGRIVTRKRVRK